MGKIKRFQIYTDKISKSTRFLLVSDIHKEKQKGHENLNKLKQQLNREFQNIDAILIAGDIINDTEDLKDKSFCEEVVEDFLSFTEEIPTIAISGNHDKLTRKGPDRWNPGDSTLLPELLGKIRNVTFLNNKETIKRREITIGGFCPNSFYFLDAEESPKEYLKQYRESFDPNMFQEKEYSILLAHDPQSIILLSKDNGECIQPYTDLVLSGHMHNGLIPTRFHKIIKNRGIIAPTMKLFPRYAQGEETIKDTLFIINGPINTRVETPMINKLYGPSATILTITPQKEKKK